MVEKLCSYHHFPPGHIIHFPLAMYVTQRLESFAFFFFSPFYFAPVSKPTVKGKGIDEHPYGLGT